MNKKSPLKPRIYTVATSHLDTSWNWDLETTIRDYIPITLKDNFLLFEKYPNYVFSFEGSYRYELMEEYYPEEFKKLKKYVADGRWHITGSSYENGDMNIPSPEAIFRNILYGNDYFYKTFGKRSIDIFLPDCFGFSYTLPSIARHANLIGFTTQKLTWSSAYGIPFDLGKWYGVDGKWIYSSLDAMGYTAELKNVRYYHNARIKLIENMKRYNLPFTYIFHGVGDKGGAPKENSVNAVCKEIEKNAKSSIDILSAPADQIFRDMDTLLTNKQKATLPVWNNELVSTDHGVGGYTSRAISKRWNRRGEQLADAAERTSVAAMQLVNYEYPQKSLDTSWKRIIAHQFHDDITGTSIVRCYQRNWNDYMLSLNQLSEEYRASVAAVSELLDTSFAKGVPVIVSNPVQAKNNRQETVSFNIQMSDKCKYIKVFDAFNKEVPSQIISKENNVFNIVFLACVPSVGYAVYDIRPSEKACALKTDLSVSEKRLENSKYIVKLNNFGDVSSIFDKELFRELLSEPIRMGVNSYKGSISWPAWELKYSEVMTKPKEYAAFPEFKIIENGPARIAIKTKRKTTTSIFEQIISLDTKGETVKFQNEIDWRSPQSLLKVQFPLTCNNQKACYDLGLGVIKRSNNTKKLYEVPAQMWADITNYNGSFGVSIFSDSKIGWDKPMENILRLTAIHSPKHCRREDCAQHLMEFGLNRFGFGVFSHKGNFNSSTHLNAAYFNQPMAVFATEAHKGKLSACYSFASISSDSVMIRAIKKAQNSDEIIVRLNEGCGSSVKEVHLTLGEGIEKAREVFASEEPIGDAKVKDGKLIFDISAYEVKSYALTLKKTNNKPKDKKPLSLDLPYNICITTRQGDNTEGSLTKGLSIPSELFPKEIRSGSLNFIMGSGNNNAVRCKGQKLDIPKGTTILYFLAFSLEGDTECVFKAGNNTINLKIADVFERIGIWDLLSHNETGQIKKDVLAWNATHTHDRDGDVYAKHAYIFKYSIPIPKDVDYVILPNCNNIFIIAATSIEKEVAFNTLTELYDSLEKRPLDFTFSDFDKANSIPSKKERKASKFKFIKTYAKNRIKREVGVLKKSN